MLKLNFIERKFIINYLSFDSVIKQYSKSISIVLTLLEQRLMVVFGLVYVHSEDERSYPLSPLQQLASQSLIGFYDPQLPQNNGHPSFPHLVLKGNIRPTAVAKNRARASMA